MSNDMPVIVVTARQLAGEREVLEERWLGRARLRWELPATGEQQVTADRLIATVGDATVLVVGDDVVDDQLMTAAPRLSLIVKWGVGMDAIDLKGAAARGIAVRNTPGLFGEEVADLAMAYLVMVTRNLLAVDAGVRAGAWPKPEAHSLSSLNVCVVGCGTVGAAVLRRLAGRTADLVAVDPDPAAQDRARAVGARVLDWVEARRGCDAVLLCRPGGADGRALLDAESITAMRRGAVIVNVARGSLVDEEALANGLRSGHLGGAALDAFAVEPLPPNSALRSAPNVVFGSHNGSYTREAIARTNEAVASILDAEVAA